MLKQTPLAETHQSMGGKMVDFGGWWMPVNYGSQIDEHHAVRQAAGMFDVSHMTIVDISGAEAKPYLERLLANNVDKLSVVGKALYTGMLNEQGGVIDDLIVYLQDWGYRLVVNCATREKDLDWIKAQSEGYDVQIQERPELAMIAVQGPEAREKVVSLIAASSERDAECVKGLGVFHSTYLSQGSHTEGARNEWMVARTGYTGEDGFEIIVPENAVASFWRALAEVGVKSCGLGARDTLRLEAGMNLYGHEMNDSVSPLVANMAWTIAWAPEDRDFIGRGALQAEKSQGVKEKLVGLVLQARGVLREGYEVSTNAGAGVITSGTFSPTLQKSIGLARVPVEAEGQVDVIIRGKTLPAIITKPCFVRQGKVIHS